MMSDPDRSIADRVTLRPAAVPDDEDFLRELYFDTRDDLDGMFADEDLKRNLLLMQHRGQIQTYARQFPDASNHVVELDGEPIGRLMVDRQPGSIRCIDISLIPEKRGNGIGSFLLKNLLDECAEKGVPCTLHVLITNPARRLYERLGFRVEEDDGTRFFMRWNG
jgi:GNAT superfamily N-acetyltransferase